MAGSRNRGSSSKTKSSKRKRHKVSSKKKSRREEPKKRRRVLDSVTFDSDNDSLNSKRSSSSTSESDHRRRINKNKKRLQASLSSSSDYESVSSDSDSDNANKSRRAQRSKVVLKDTKRGSGKRYTSPSVHKRKRLERDHVRKKIKKSSKKKSRKYSSISSSSDSESQSRSSSSTEDCKIKPILNKDIEKARGRKSHGGKKKRKVRPSFDGDSQPSVSVRKKHNVSPSFDEDSHPSVSVRKKHKVSPSFDDYSRPSVSVSLSNGDERPYSRRLKSIIVVVDPPNHDEEKRWEMDLHKEEIVYDNDYPSPKSVDSNEGGGRMESTEDSHGAFNKRICVENVADVEVGKSIIDIEKENETDVSVPEAASSGGDLQESLLRQRALENLRKFKGRIQTGLRSSTDKMRDEIDMDGQNKLIDQGNTDDKSGLPSREEICLNKLPDSEEDPLNGTAVLECSKKDITESRSDTGPGTSGANECTVESSSAVGPVSGEHSLEQGNEAKDGSQFKEKTMSVMRGGELVQVSYKVYIPKKAPGLARRQLRR